MPSGATMAADEPWVHAVLRRNRRNAWLTLLAGVVLFGLVGTAANVFVGNSERLRESGGRAPGVVVGFGELSASHDNSADVAYTVDGHRYEEEVALGNHRGDYRLDQQVTVYYDLTDPSEITIDDINNEPTWTVMPMAIGFVGGVCLMGYGVAALVSNHRKRKLLRRNAWRDATVLGSRPTGGVYLRTDDVPLLRASTDAAAVTDEPRVRAAGSGERYLVALGDEPTALVRARPPGSDREAGRWRADFVTDPAPTT